MAKKCQIVQLKSWADIVGANHRHRRMVSSCLNIVAILYVLMHIVRKSVSFTGEFSLSPAK